MSKNQKEVITKNKKFPFNKLKVGETTYTQFLKLKNNIKNEQQKDRNILHFRTFKSNQDS